MKLAVLLASCAYPPLIEMHSPSLPQLRQEVPETGIPGSANLFKRGGPQSELAGWQPLDLHLYLVLSL